MASTVGCDTAVLTDETAGTVLTCTAVNGAGLTAAAAVTVRIDRTPPDVVYSGNLGTYTVDLDVAITCMAGDSLSGLASSTCADVLGPAYSFALGTNTFTAEAVDRAGNIGAGSVSFEVIVTYDSLGKLAERFVTRPGILKSLQAKLDAAEAASGRGNTRAAAGALEAFIHEVEAQTGKAISAEGAALLIRLAQHLLAQL